ncbi:MAG: RGCVC family protein [Kibdelosporangium sp.]
MNSDLRTIAEIMPEADVFSDAVCATCPHPWQNHDQIAVRYCTATAANGHLDRGCVCTGKETR